MCVGLIAILRLPKFASQATLVELTMKTFKILLRKEINRVNMSKRDVAVIMQALRQHSGRAAVVREGANAILNMCYEKANVVFVVENGGVELLLAGVAAGNPPSVQASCAGALQSVS